jgi:hypothetical protein
MTELPALEAALRKKAAMFIGETDGSANERVRFYGQTVASAYTDAANMVAAMMREGEK